MFEIWLLLPYFVQTSWLWQPCLFGDVPVFRCRPPNEARPKQQMVAAAICYKSYSYSL